jgi:hypothetical protein
LRETGACDPARLRTKIAEACSVTNKRLGAVKRTGTGLAFFLYPLFSGFAFVAHPNLMSLEVTGVAAKVAEFHGNPIMHFGHFVMLMGVPLLVVIALELMRLTKERAEWWGLIGCAMAVFGAILLAVDKTALCIVMSAFETVPEAEYAQLFPGIEALFNFKGYVAILYLLPLLPIGFLVLGIGLYRARAIPRWQSAGLIASMLGMGVATAGDIDLFGLVATVILAVSFFPIGFQLIKR